MNKDIYDCVEFLLQEIVIEYTKERFLSEEEFEDLKKSSYSSLIRLSQEGQLKFEVKDGNLSLKLPLRN